MTAKKEPAATIACLLPTCGVAFAPKRAHQKFHSPRCRMAAFELERGTRERWRTTAQELADVVRACITTGVLPTAVEKRATTALHKAMPYRTTIRVPRKRRAS